MRVRTVQLATAKPTRRRDARRTARRTVPTRADAGHDGIESVLAFLAFLLCIVAMGFCGGIERGTIPLPF
jgi:hypothetical protein